jgi:hypothetical protein
VRRLCLLGLVIWLGGLLGGIVRAETFQLNNGQTVSGTVISFNENGLRLRLGQDQYSDWIPWSNFSQADLGTFAKNPKIAPLVEPFIEVPEEERTKKTDVVIKEVLRLERPPPHSLLGAFFGSSVGLATLLLIYAANLYAAREVAIFRAQPFSRVCGVSAVLPLIGPVIFLVQPTRMKKVEKEPEAEAPARGVMLDVSTTEAGFGVPAAGGLALARPEEAPAELPETQVFQRGQFTFNRRFFESRFPGFFGIVRPAAEKDMVLTIKSSRGEFEVQRISRIAANDLHIEVQEGIASREVMVPFIEIREIQLKHKDA